MKKWLAPVFFVCAAAVAFCTVSCEKYALPRLECDTDTIWAPVEGGIYNAVISSNVRWAFTGEQIPEWIYIDVKYGEPKYVDTDYPIQIKVSKSKEADARESVMEFTSATLIRKLVVEQEGTGIEPEPEPETGGE